MTKCSLSIGKDWLKKELNVFCLLTKLKIQNSTFISSNPTFHVQVIDKLEMCGKPSLNAVTRYTANLSFNWLSTL